MLSLKMERSVHFSLKKKLTHNLNMKILTKLNFCCEVYDL